MSKCYDYLAQVKARCEAASPGPWRFTTRHYKGPWLPREMKGVAEWEEPAVLWTRWEEEEGRQRCTTASFNSCGGVRESAERSMADARLIAHARTDIEALLEMLDVALGEVNLPGDINDTWHELDRLVPERK